MTEHVECGTWTGLGLVDLRLMLFHRLAFHFFPIRYLAVDVYMAHKRRRIIDAILSTNQAFQPELH
mgnify:FL=1